MEVAKKNLVCLIAVLLFVILLSQRSWNNPSLDFTNVWRAVSQQDVQEDKLLHGLLPPNLDEESCLSRYQMNNFLRRASPHKPSPSLVSKLRAYEDLHRRCGPASSPYHQSLQILTATQNSTSPECNYLIIRTRDGLGNRILALISAFFYALLSDRILLVDSGNGLDSLFCEPFPEWSWFLPADFPLRPQFNSFRQSFPESFGNILRNRGIASIEESPPNFLYLHLSHDASDHDRLFYCDHQQQVLKKVPWLVMETNNYLIPGVFLIPCFRAELNKLFPAKDTVFHHLGRYLLHPENEVWGLIQRSYEPYLARANQMIGIQIRVFGSESGSFEDQMKQLLACTQQKNLLPEIGLRSNFTADSKPHQVKVVLVTSLSAQYQENLKEMYRTNPTVNGDLVAVYQPSHEGFQSSDKTMHNRKALAEIFLLSFSDVLVTSSWSTFGYVAHGLAGLRPWILYKPEEKMFWPMQWWVRYKTRNQTAEDWPCRRGASMEPCFHTPPVCDCVGMNRSDGGEVLPFVTHCEDASWGLKLVDSEGEIN